METIDRYPVLLTPPGAYRPTLMARSHMVSSGHYLATAAAFRILERGGNAVDAGVAAGLALNVVHSDMTSLGGVAPIIIYLSGRREVWTISGIGWWSEEATLERVLPRIRGDQSGIAHAVAPAAAAAWITALERFGTLSFAEVAAPAIELCEEGFPLFQYFQDTLRTRLQRILASPSSAEVYLPGGQVPAVGTLLVQRDHGRTLRRLAEAEASARDNGREAGLRAAREYFYQGPIAEAMVQFCQSVGGFLTLRDLAEFRVDVEPSVAVLYRGYQVHACGPWCQGPVVLQALKILEGYDMHSFGHNSAEHLHLLTEALKAAFADRHAYYGDPRVVSVPLSGLLSDVYAVEWRKRIRLHQAAPTMPEPGNPWSFATEQRQGSTLPPYPPEAISDRMLGSNDTSYVCVVDAEGNGFSATPSDGLSDSPVVPGLGIRISTRGIQSYHHPDHPNSIAPRKRPRLTPNPGLVLQDGRLWMLYGTPGGDVQPQAMTQLLLNVIDFRMDLQAAVEAARVASYSFPQSDYPHACFPGELRAESRIPLPVLARLSDLRHRMYIWPELVPAAGGLCAIQIDPQAQTRRGGADPRRLSYVFGW
ncbi:MAG: gamma-glutamyltransferase [Armatimonadetes bacterium]|nr:gamma-glutamyltransferase [Armatimonadota bacterium]